MTNISAFVHNGISVEIDQDFINLTKLWEMAGRPENQNPYEWSRLPQTIKLISQVLCLGEQPKRSSKVVGLAEAIASEKMDSQNADGFSQCKNICTDSGERVNRVFV